MAEFKRNRSNRSDGMAPKFVRGNNNRRSSNGSGRRDGNRSGRRDSREPERFQRGMGRTNRRSSVRPERTRVICDDCGKSCEVPFKPTSDKPIYCDSCFRKDSSPRGSGSRSGGNEKQLAEINKKLDLIMEALEIN